MDGGIILLGYPGAGACQVGCAWEPRYGVAWRLLARMLRPTGSARPAAGRELIEDEALLAKVAAGDRGPPLEELYGRYERRLYGLGLRLLGDQGLAEELVQDTFVRLWQQAGRFDPTRGSAGAFLFAIARHIAIDLWRRPSSRPFEPEPTLDQPSSSDLAGEVIEGLTVRDALDTLTPPHRQVLELYYLEDYTQTEIAEQLGLPRNTVKTRTWYALRALKLALEERGIHA
jgi:RNA polymerase sigma-70 factor, ECF subfamily